MASSRPLSPQPLSGISLSSSMREAVPGKTQRHLDVEARVLSNWQEFVKHRQEVQLQLREIHEALQRAASNESALRQHDTRFEAEVERVNYRLQQLSKVQDEMLSRFNDQSALGSANDVLHTRFMEKLQDLTSTVDSHQRDVSKIGEGLLREAADTAKRASKSVAEELLRKMEELNTKLGDNMAHLEEQSAWGLKRVQQDVKDLVSRLDGGAYAAEAELRKLEAKLEGAWRTRISDVQTQSQEAAERAARTDRDAANFASQVSKLGNRLQECMAQVENLDAVQKQCGQRIDGSSARMEEVQASLLDQIGRTREDMSALVHEQQRALRKALDSHLEDSQDHTQRLRVEVSGSVEDACVRVDTLREVIRGHEGEIASMRSVLGNAEQRVEDLASSLSTTRDGAQEDLIQMQHAVREELGSQIKQTADQLDIRAREIRLQMDSLRLELSESKGNIGEHAEQLALLQDRTQSVSSMFSDHQKRAEQRAEQTEQNLRSQKESVEQRIRTMQLNLTEQIHHARDEVQRLCRERIDECTQSGQQLHDLQEQQLRDMRVDVHGRLDALELSASEQSTAVGEHSRRLYEQACQQSRAWCDDALAQNSKLVGEMGEHLAAQIKDHGQQADTHRRALEAQHTALEARHTESRAQLRSSIEDLLGQHGSWHTAEKERSARVTKLCVELQEAKTGLANEVELSQKMAQRQLQEQETRWEKRLESSMAGISSHCSTNIAECRTAALDAAREAGSKAELAANEQMRSHYEVCSDSLKREIAVVRNEVKEAQGHQVSRLAALSHEHALAQRMLDDRFRQNSDSFIEQLANMRSDVEDQLHQQHSTLSQQISEVGEHSAEKQRHFTSAHITQLEEVKHGFTEQMRKMVSNAEEHGTMASQKVDDKLSKLVHTLGQDVSELQGITRSLGERVTSHRDQHAETQQKVEERLAQQLRSVSQEVAEAKAVSVSHGERLAKHQDQTADVQHKLEERLTKELQGTAHNAHERCDDLHARLENQQRMLAGMQEHTEQQVTKKLREHAQNIDDLHVTSRQLTDCLTSHQAKTNEDHQKTETHFQQMLRDVRKEVAELQDTAHGFAEQLHSHKSQQTGDINRLAESLTEKVTRQSEKAAEQLAEVRDSLTESARQATEASNVHLSRMKDRSDEEQRETKTRLKELDEASQFAEKQFQEYRQQVTVRSADAEARLAALRQDLEQKEKQQDEDIASMTARLLGLERRVGQDRESNNALVEAHSQQTEKKMEANSERLTAALSEQMRVMVGTSEERCAATTLQLDERLNKLVRTLDERLSKNVQVLGQDLAEVQVAARSLSERGSSYRDQQAEALQKAEERLALQLRSVGQEVSDLKAVSAGHGERLTNLQQKTEEKTSKLQHSFAQDVRQLQSASQNVNERCDGLHSTLETQQRLLGVVQEQTDMHISKSLRDQAQHIEDLHATSRGLNESLDFHKNQTAEAHQKMEGRSQQMIRDVQREITELQAALKGVGEQLQNQQAQHSGMMSKVQENFTDKLTRQSEKCMEQLVEARDALTESARHSREDVNEKIVRLQQLSDSCNEQLSRLRERADEQQRETKNEFKEFEQSLAESSQLAKKQIQESRVQLTARCTDGDSRLTALRQDVEMKAKQQMDELSALITRSVDDARRNSTSAVKDLAESAERRFREHGEASAKSAAELSAQQAKIETELRSLVHTKSQGHETRLNEVCEQLIVANKDLKDTSDELTAVNRRQESTRQTHSANLEEHKRSFQERHSQLGRRVQGESENLARLAQQVATLEDELKARHREQEEHTRAAVSGVQELAQQDSVDLRAELAALQAGLQGVHSELGSALRTAREKHGAAIADLGRRQEDWMLTAQRRFEEVEGLSSQARLLALFAEHVEGIVRTVSSRELQVFQREALDSIEWKLERCVQWLHGANVKLGLNPHGTMFSTDRFRAMLFDESQKPSGAPVAAPGEPGMNAATPRTQRRRSNSAKAGLGLSRGGVRSTP